MENIKLGNLHLSKKESTNMTEFLTKMRDIKNYKNKSIAYIAYIKFSKNNQKINKE